MKIIAEVGERIFGGDCRVTVCTSSVVKMKEHEPFCIEDRAFVDSVV